ncbi:MAG TPA: type IX secretion system protein PorQ [Chitinophagaceae bacterium]
MRYILFLINFIIVVNATGQTLGGSTVFNFMKLPNTPQVTALGGINLTQPSNDVGLAYNNPSQLKPEMHTQLNAVFNSFYGDIKTYHLAMGYRSEKLQTNFLYGLHYFAYGSLAETDASGNELGTLRPTDWVMQLAASRAYLQRWNYGAALKFINSNYGQYRSNGIAMDVGVRYSDTANLLSVSILAKNMGFQLKQYAGTDPGDMPFDLQIGLTKRLKNAPLSFSVTAHHLHQFDISYNDTTFNNDNDFDNGSDAGFSLDKLFRHFVFASTVYIVDRVEVQAGYNFLRRKELNIGSGGNGLNGFSFGVAVLLNKLTIRYARAQYQSNTGYNQLGLNLQLNQYFGLGKLGERIGW